MSWSESVYVCFSDETAAQAQFDQIGITDQSYVALVSPFTQWTRWPGTNSEDDPGEAASGYWAMMRFNTDTPEGTAAYTAIQGSGALVDPTTITPSVVFA